MQCGHSNTLRMRSYRPGKATASKGKRESETEVVEGVESQSSASQSLSHPPANLPSTKSKGKSRRPPTKKNGNNNVQIGCNVTHKVHLMWPHVADQMKYVSGGLDKKMEDWVERQH